MRKEILFAGFCFGLCASLGIAQTVTTTGGTQNKVPKFSGNSVISDSAITEANGNVGIGTMTPAYPLDVNGGIDAATVIGTAMFTGHQVGGSYIYPDAIFKAVTDNTNGSANYYFQGLTGSTTNFSVRADGQAYFASGISSGNLGFVSSYRNPSNNYTNLFLGGALVDNGNGSYSVQTDGGSNYFAAIRMDNSGGNAGAINFYTAGSTGGSNYTISTSQLSSYQRMTIVGSNVGIGTATPSAKLEVNGSLKLSGSGSSITFPNGEVQSIAWNGTLCGGDYAESVDVSGDHTRYEPGDVLVVSDGDSADVAKSSQPYSALVVGVYSTKPGVLGRRQTGEKNANEIPMAMVGIVPVKVSTENGPIKKGDPLVTASVPGYAMKGTERDRMFNAVLGKALGSLESGTGVIEAFISLQ